MTLFALVDCNNFYVSCERAFNPILEGKPVVVLSNNDGCIISRSAEAKKLGILMGAPFYQCQDFCKKNNVFVFSSNYELYGDMSQRIMTLLRQFCPDIEVYSIDEAFLVLDGFMHQDFSLFLTDIREKIKKFTGIPVSVGLGPTKTLAKAANYLAKNTSGVFDLCDVNQQEKILSEFPIERLWGIGSKLSRRLKKYNIHNAKELRDSHPKMIHRHFGVMTARVIEELKGISCIPLDSIQPRKQIISSRSFGKAVTTLNDLEEAISNYAATAALKLRNQQCVTGAISVFLQTNRYREQDTQYSNSVTFTFPVPTADTSYILHAAKKCIKHLYRKGYRYNKAGLMLLDLTPISIFQFDMLAKSNPQKSELMMETMDKINHFMGKETVFFCAQGIQRPWQAKFEKRTSRYTTRWSELVKVV